ncbi:hypothetical protein PG990_001270 [Apiospora arundinis]
MYNEDLRGSDVPLVLERVLSQTLHIADKGAARLSVYGAFTSQDWAWAWQNDMGDIVRGLLENSYNKPWESTISKVMCAVRSCVDWGLYGPKTTEDRERCALWGLLEKFERSEWQEEEQDNNDEGVFYTEGADLYLDLRNLFQDESQGEHLDRGEVLVEILRVLDQLASVEHSSQNHTLLPAAPAATWTLLDEQFSKADATELDMTELNTTQLLFQNVGILGWAVAFLSLATCECCIQYTATSFTSHPWPFLRKVKRNTVVIHGNKIRLEPNTVLFRDPDAYAEIYGMKSNTTLDTVDVKEHTRKRRLLNISSTEKSVRAVSTFVIRHVDRWHQLLVEGNGTEWSAPIDFFELLDTLSFDIMGGLSFGKSFDVKERGKNSFKSIPYNIMQDLRFYYPMEKPEEEQRQDIFHFLCEARDPETGTQAYDETSLRAEANLLIIAGSDTTAVSLSGIFWYLIHDSLRCQKLVDELMATFESANDIVYGSKLSSCVYLRACIDEGMRLTHSGPCELSQEVLRGGLKVSGEYLPGGTIVGTVPWVVSRNEEVYGHVNVFRPEHWIANEAAGVTKEQRRDQQSQAGPLAEGQAPSHRAGHGHQFQQTGRANGPDGLGAPPAANWSSAPTSPSTVSAMRGTRFWLTARIHPGEPPVLANPFKELTKSTMFNNTVTLDINFKRRFPKEGV